MIGAYNDYATRVDLSSNELERCSNGLTPGSAAVFACIRVNSRSLRDLLANFDQAIAAIKFPDDVKADLRRLGEADNRLGSLYETLAGAGSPPSPAVRAALLELAQGGADQKTAVENLARDLRAKR